MSDISTLLTAPSLFADARYGLLLIVSSCNFVYARANSLRTHAAQAFIVTRYTHYRVAERSHGPG